MSSKELHRRFMSLCKKWPVDESKQGGRDYAEFFRQQLTQYFSHGELGVVRDSKFVDARLTSLEKIANNNYYNENHLKRSSASGLEAWACKLAISNDGIRLINEESDVKVMQKLRTAMNFKFDTYKSSEQEQAQIDDTAREDAPEKPARNK